MAKRERSEAQRRHTEELNAQRRAEREAYASLAKEGKVPAVPLPPEPEPVAPPSDPADSYEAMRRVLSGIPAGQMTPLERSYKAMLEDRPVEFVRQYAVFQSAEQAKAAPQAAASVPVEEAPPEKAEELIDRLLGS